MSAEEMIILEMLEEMNQIAHIAQKIKNIAGEIDETIFAANVKTFDKAKSLAESGREMDFSEAFDYVTYTSLKVSDQLNNLITEVSGFKTTTFNTNIFHYSKKAV